MTHTRLDQANVLPKLVRLQAQYLQGVRKDIPDPHKFPQKAPTSCKDPLLATRAAKKVLLFPQSQKVEQRCAYVTGPSSLGKQEAPESTGPDHVLGRELLSLDGLELNSRYPTTTSRVCLCPCCYS